MSVSEKTASDHQGISAPKTLVQLLVLLVRETIKAIPRQIPLIIGIFVLGTLLHTFLMAGPNGGYGRELTLLSDLLATRGSYGVEGTGNNTLIAPLIWAVLSALAFYTFFRIKSVGLGEYLAGFTRGVGWIFKSFSALAARAVPALSVGGAIALAIVGLTKNNAIGLVLCAPLIAALGEQLDSLWFTFLRLSWNDVRRLTKRLAKSEKPFNPAMACVGTVGAALGFLAGYILPGVRFSGTWAFVGALFLGAVALAFSMLRKKGLQPPTALLLAFLLASMFVALPVYAHDKGVKEEGGWRNWLTQPGVLEAIAQGISPAAVAALGLPAGAALSAVWNALQNIKPDIRVQIYNEIKTTRPGLEYPDSIKVPHDYDPTKPPPPAKPPPAGGTTRPSGGSTLNNPLQTILQGTGGAPAPPQGPGTGTAPPAAPPLPTRTTVYDGKEARDILRGMGIFTADQIKSATQRPNDLDTLLGNKNPDKMPYSQALHDIKDSKGNTTGMTIRNIRDVKGIAFEEDKGQINWDKIAIVVEEDDTTVTLEVKPGPKPPGKPKPPVKPAAGPKPPVKPGAGPKPPVKPGTGPKPPIKPGAGPKPPVKPGTGPKPPVKPGAGATPPVKPGAGATPPVKPGAGAKPPVKPAKPPTPPTITSVLQDRIKNSLSNANSAGVSQLSLTMDDFKGMIPEQVDLPFDAGSVKRPTLTFDSKNGLMTVKTDEFMTQLPLGLSSLDGAEALSSTAPASVVAQPVVENGRLVMNVQSAQIPKMPDIASKTLANRMANHALGPINQMLKDRGATLTGVKVVDGGIQLTLQR